MHERRRRSLMIASLLAATATMMTSLLLLPDAVEADRQVFVLLNSFQDPYLTGFFWIITALGSLGFGLIWFGGLCLMNRTDLAAYILVAIVMEVVIVTIMKDAILRPRPINTITDVAWLYSQGSWSFPSGHAAQAFALFTVIGLKVKRVLPFMALIASVVAFSRIFIGVHYPLDVIAGSLIGILIGLFTANLDLSRFASKLERGRTFLSNKLSRISR